MALVLERFGVKTRSPPMPQHQKKRKIKHSVLKAMWEGGWWSGELGAGKLGAGELGSSEIWSRKLVSWGAGELGSWELGAGKLGAGELGSSEMWSWELVSWGAGELGPTLTHSSGVPPRATPDEPPSAAAMLTIRLLNE